MLPRRENFRKFVERSFSPARRILTRVLLILTQRNALRRLYAHGEIFVRAMPRERNCGVGLNTPRIETRDIIAISTHAKVISYAC